MRVQSLAALLPLLLSTTVSAAPGWKIPSAGELATQAFTDASDWVHHAFSGVKEEIKSVEYSINQLKTEKVTVKGIECESTRHRVQEDLS